MTRSDILLAIIAAARGQPLQPVHLQKVAFLVGQEFPHDMPPDYYQFDSYRYGPFAAGIYADADALEYWGQIHISQSDQPKNRKYSCAEHVSLDAIDLPRKMLQYISETVLWAREQSFQELARSVYYMYPEYMANSAFDFSEDDAFMESFSRGISDYRQGRVQPARAWLDELCRETEAEAHADPAVE